MVDPIFITLSKFLMMPVKELMYPRIIFSLFLPVIANLICFYGIGRKLKIFGKGKSNDFISFILGLFFTYFAVKLGFIIGMIGLWFGLEFLV